MNDIRYANACSEVLTILKYIPLEDYNKIPKSKIELFQANANRDYVFSYDPLKTLDEQNVSKITKGIIAILFRDYWATETQREKILAKQNYDREKLEKGKRAIYNINNILGYKDNHKLEQNIESNTAVSKAYMVEYKESFFKKIINKLKNIFKFR